MDAVLHAKRAEFHYPLRETPYKPGQPKHHGGGALIVLSKQFPKHGRRHDGDQHFSQSHNTDRAWQSIDGGNFTKHFASSEVAETDFPAAYRIMGCACAAG